MAGKTTTRADLADAVHREMGISRNESAGFVERILEEISGALENGETVKISSFGTFSVRDKKLRMGRNPKTGEEVPITPRRVVAFRASHVLKDNINAALVRDSATAAE
ncbi:integration host factor subunit alpha [Amphiplicatus metriothermophilus]|uniref:Integration host factor subunit alpha n=1 Tax=Amphiplicatus metriothermophilus TaxID=1519374 RepID=A0A239PQ16_9PROT|nr:integration host factor subunit alpha [Amphiplicatus metriothermophilus]MBB5518841.1 integration host factor subunit alpha [Amphiplicatus metriothermophilus]SNT72006.1 integration host factor subunit alpha [Amphiplicatus metriothermophilus]